MERNPVFIACDETLAEKRAVQRHVLCPNYDICLEEAVRKDQSFVCSQCCFKKKNITAYLIHDGMAA